MKVFPVFIDTYIPRASDYPDKPHIKTGKSVRHTLEGVSKIICNTIIEN